MANPEIKYEDKMTGKKFIIKHPKFKTQPFSSKTSALSKVKEYTGKKGEYSKYKQGNFMKVHPLDRY